MIDANCLEYLVRLLTKPRKLCRSLALPGDFMASMAVTFLLSGLAPSGVQGGQRNSLHHSLTVAHPKLLRPPKMPGVNKFLSFYSVILKLGTNKELVNL